MGEIRGPAQPWAQARTGRMCGKYPWISRWSGRLWRPGRPQPPRHPSGARCPMCARAVFGARRERHSWRPEVETVREIIVAMQEAAPPGREHLDGPTLDRLRALTQSLLAASAYADSEYLRFQETQHRGLELPGDDARDWLTGKTILVTGGTGCVGSMLMRQLACYRPRRLICISRGVTDGWPRLPGAEYVQADVRDRPALAALVGVAKPDVLFHVAAQRDPGLAEHEVHRTVTTNVL